MRRYSVQTCVCVEMFGAVILMFVLPCWARDGFGFECNMF